jgi:hypothetical protein
MSGHVALELAIIVVCCGALGVMLMMVLAGVRSLSKDVPVTHEAPKPTGT